ncbi:telomere-protecting terminal protein Tpg [Streptomyces termitum]|uniref:telomere-protecting terminal protein Tpg n=1 Tax=Streptomyces termitum TaxID=67368 RepID=UPI0033B2AA52
MDVGEIVQGLERALRTRPVPSDTKARLRFLLAAHRGSTLRVAAVLGVSQRTVQRWVTKKPGARRQPGPAQIQAIEAAVLERWQPRIRARLQARAEAEGFVLHTRARFGFAAAAGASDDPRARGAVFLTCTSTPRRAVFKQLSAKPAKRPPRIVEVSRCGLGRPPPRPGVRAGRSQTDQGAAGGRPRGRW